MLTEVKYNPNSVKPFSVIKKTPHGWVSVGEFPYKDIAIDCAKKASLEADLPCLIARYDNGNCIDGVINSPP